jgi:hypothetical protein
VLVRLRVADPSKQPRLRVAIDDNRNFYRHLNIGAGEGVTKLTDKWGQGFLFPFENLPDNVEQFHIGFDLMSAGEVWIDDVRLYDVWFQRHQRNDLVNRSGLADFQLNEGKVRDSFRFLDSYWARFLMEHVEPKPQRVAELPRAATTPPQEQPAPSPTTWQRMRELVPKIPLPSPFSPDESAPQQ